MEHASERPADHGTEIVWAAQDVTQSTQSTQSTPDDQGNTTTAEESRRARTRIKHACDLCRRRKIKCDGGRPFCLRCRELRLKCSYGAGKRDDLKTVRTKLSRVQTLLESLLPHHDAPTQQAIREALNETNQSEESFSASGEGTSAPGRDADDSPVGAGVDSSLGVARLRLDSAGSARATGFYGKASIVRWIQDLSESMTIASSKPCHPGPNSTAATAGVALADVSPGVEPGPTRQLLLQAATYHLNHLDLHELGPFGQQVDAFQVPPRQTADVLVDAFFTTVYPLFPVLSRPLFQRQYHLFWQTLISGSPGLTVAWRAQLNLIFAIGAAYGQTTQVPGTGDEPDHLQYFIRARLLSLQPLGFIELPDLEHVQLAALTGMYLIATCQINRAWHIVGLALRCGQSRALHLRNDAPGADEAQRELEAGLWHSLTTLERLLCFLTGRPPAIEDLYCSTPLPTQNDDAGSSAGSQASPSPSERRAPSSSMPPPRSPNNPPSALDAFTASLQLDKIVAETMSQLYSAAAAHINWTSFQSLITLLNSKLKDWRVQLPPTLSLTNDPGSSSKPPLRERMYLALRFFSTSITINRPCLCAHRPPENPTFAQSRASQAVDQHSSLRCISSARELINLFPDEVNVPKMYSSTPWWCVLHFLVQGIVVLTLEISLGCMHMPEESDEIIEDAAKALRWLHGMSESSVAALRAYRVLGRLLAIGLSQIGKEPDEALAAHLPSDPTSMLDHIHEENGLGPVVPPFAGTQPNFSGEYFRPNFRTDEETLSMPYSPFDNPNSGQLSTMTPPNVGAPVHPFGPGAGMPNGDLQAHGGIQGSEPIRHRHRVWAQQYDATSQAGAHNAPGSLVDNVEKGGQTRPGNISGGNRHGQGRAPVSGPHNQPPRNMDPALFRGHMDEALADHQYDYSMWDG
ncbi:MAG: hypothetical protein M4579_005872 [Chaenotheca gracillima]|nr:MAG: hypothetical protein M4579_005872 [Chaenotheca gracillima]